MKIDFLEIKKLVELEDYKNLRDILLKYEDMAVLTKEGYERREEITEIQKKIIECIPLEELAHSIVTFAKMDIEKSGRYLLLQVDIQEEINKKWEKIMNEGAKIIGEKYKEKMRDK